MSVAEEESGPASPPRADHDAIRIVGAREHNLKGVSLRIPKNKITVFTGVSGSGKSSIVFDTADWIIDLGPDGGKNGGEVVFTGTPRQLLAFENSLTAEHLRRHRRTP
jgi:excinuclease UvrABC ATPase subunit